MQTKGEGGTKGRQEEVVNQETQDLLAEKGDLKKKKKEQNADSD